MAFREDIDVRRRFILYATTVAVVVALLISAADLLRGRADSMVWNSYYLGALVVALIAYLLTRSRLAWSLFVGHTPVVHFSIAGPDELLLAYFWVFVFPLVLFFVLGFRRGIAVVGALAVAVGGIAVYRGSESGLVGENPDMLLSFATVCVLAGLYEYMREGYARRIEELAATDSLTGVANRRRFDEQLADEIERAWRYGRSLTLLYIDIDEFKQLNDTYGHQEGDRVLVEFARVIDETVRSTDRFARLGGDEFAIIAPETSADPETVDHAPQLAARLRRAVAQHDFDVDHPVSISIGIAEYVEGDEPDTLLKRADNALYIAKERGTDQAVA